MSAEARAAWANRYAAIPSSGTASVPTAPASPPPAPATPGQSWWGWDGRIADGVWDNGANALSVAVAPAKALLWDYPAAFTSLTSNAAVGIANKIETGDFGAPEQMDPRVTTVRVVTRKLVDEYGMSPQQAASVAESAVDANGEFDMSAVRPVLGRQAAEEQQTTPSGPVLTREQLIALQESEWAAEELARVEADIASQRAFAEQGIDDYRDMVMSGFASPLDFSDINAAELAALTGNSNQYDAANKSIAQVYADAIGSIDGIAGSMSSVAAGQSAETQALYAGLADSIASNNSAIADEMAAVYGIDGGVSGDAVDASAYAGSEAQVRASEIMNGGNVQADLVRTMAAAMPEYQANQSVAAQRIMAARDLGIRSKYSDIRLAEQRDRADAERDALSRVADMQFQANQDLAQFERDRRATPSARQQLIDAARLDVDAATVEELFAGAGGRGRLPEPGAGQVALILPDNETTVSRDVSAEIMQGRAVMAAGAIKELVANGASKGEAVSMLRLQLVNDLMGEFDASPADAAGIEALAEQIINSIDI